MPPKRAATGAPSAAHKKSKASARAAGAPEPEKEVPRNKRWAKVSGSANADMNYLLAVRNPLTAYNYTLMCRPPFKWGSDGDGEWEDDDEEDDDEEDDDEEEDTKGRAAAPCDSGKTCLCDKDPEEHPDHMWVVTVAAKHKFFIQIIHCDLRCPDNFNMYTFNDHTSYGVLEVVQNLVLDFIEADSWKEQWVVCEALALFLNSSWAEPMCMIDDGEQFSETLRLLGRLFLCMLARLEREKLLAKDSEVKNLGMVMAMFVEWTRREDESFSYMNDPKAKALGPAKDGKKWNPALPGLQIVAYADKYGIELKGPQKFQDYIKELDAAVDLPVPASNAGPKADPFSFAKALAKYEREHACAPRMSSAGKLGMGGDNLDITVWTSAERKRYSFNGKDPLGPREIKAIKDGSVMQLG